MNSEIDLELEKLRSMDGLEFAKCPSESRRGNQEEAVADAKLKTLFGKDMCELESEVNEGNTCYSTHFIP